MNWLTYALLALFFYGLFDFFLKLASGKINEGVSGFIINIVAALVVLIYVIYSKINGENVFTYKTSGILFSVLGGVAVGLVTIFYIKMFATGTNLSIGSPLVRVGTVLFASILGILLLKEGINVKYAVGFLLSLLGLFLIVTK